MLASFPEVTEVNLLAHSMGNWVALEALARKGDAWRPNPEFAESR
jgi:esterase/lipase superfamily enzyme